MVPPHPPGCAPGAISDSRAHSKIEFLIRRSRGFSNAIQFISRSSLGSTGISPCTLLGSRSLIALIELTAVSVANEHFAREYLE